MQERKKCVVEVVMKKDNLVRVGGEDTTWCLTRECILEEMVPCVSESETKTYLEHVIHAECGARSQTAKLVKRRSKSNEVEAEVNDDETRA